MAAVFETLALLGGPVEFAEIWHTREAMYLSIENKTKKLTAPKALVYETTDAENGACGFSERAIKWKNLLGSALAIAAMDVSFVAMQGLQSSVNGAGGMGLISLTVMYACVMVSCLFSPLIVRLLGTKHTLFVTLSIITAYSLTTFYPSWYTLVPISAVVGLAYGPMFTSLNIHMTAIAMHYAPALDEKIEHVMSTSAGILYFFIPMAEVFGNIASSVILFQSSANLENQTTEFNDSACVNNHAEDIAPLYLYILGGVYTVFNVASVVIVIMTLDQVIKSDAPLSGYLKECMRGPMFEICQLAINWRMILLLPMILFSGLGRGFIWARYTETFVASCLGVDWIGLVVTAYATILALTAIITGRAMKYVPKYLLVTMAALINSGLILCMLYWKKSPNRFVVFAIAAGWGVGDGIWNILVLGITGVMFSEKHEAAYSLMRFWRSSGIMLAYLSTYFATLEQQLEGVLGLVMLIFISYTVLAVCSGRRIHSCISTHPKYEWEKEPMDEKQYSEKSSLLESAESSLSVSYNI